MKTTFVITLLTSIALTSYVDYDSDSDSGWSYEPQESTYIEYDSNWTYEPNYVSSYSSYSDYVDSIPPREDHHHHHYNSNSRTKSQMFYVYQSENVFFEISYPGFIFIVLVLSIAGCAGIGFGVGELIRRKRVKERKEIVDEFALEVREVDINNIDAANEGNYVFVKGSLIIDGSPRCPKFSMSTQNEVWIKRRVEVYCWKEELREFKERRGD